MNRISTEEHERSIAKYDDCFVIEWKKGFEEAYAEAFESGVDEVNADAMHSGLVTQELLNETKNEVMAKMKASLHERAERAYQEWLKRQE